MIVFRKKSRYVLDRAGRCGLHGLEEDLCQLDSAMKGGQNGAGNEKAVDPGQDQRLRIWLRGQDLNL
jgi:hypothetical protein